MPANPADAVVETTADTAPPRRVSNADQELIRPILDGDEQAFAQLVRREQALLSRLARSFVRTAASAEEVTQETWLALLEGLKRFERRRGQTARATARSNDARRAGTPFQDLEGGLKPRQIGLHVRPVSSRFAQRSAERADKNRGSMRDHFLRG